MSWPKACEASGSRASHAHGSMAGPCVAELAGGSRAGFILSSLDKGFFCTSLCCHGSQADFPRFGSPTKQSFAQRCCCTPREEVLGSLSRFPCAAAAAAEVASHPGPPGTPTCHRTGVFLHQMGLILTSQPGPAGQHWYTAGTGGSHPAPFGVVKSVLPVLPSSHTVYVTVTKVK